ncbi:hypothetical protein HMPREF2953_03620 [Staphylococcus sp. HMSC072E01]|uniref:DUF3310 domain-containing protein n=1 Tax=Staphylococcus sp. HMSC072E01 TaxID=1739457 RepID=UPI0008A44AC2|nr:DUF3310 domain-containing protein [Staphylococcus sp. HMSC072E01]OFQ11048.1 hypothetical protein HMPREF2953_03620 [Staphylococcus sp. HMSC072E01]
MENVRVAELNKDDIVQFQCANKKFSAFQTAIVNQVYAEEKRLKTVWKAEVENQAGRTFTITDNDDFIRVKEPFTRKVDMVKEPNHYTSDEGIDLIEFCKQQFTEEEFRGAMKFTQLRYALRTGRKENDLQDQQKLKEYANRFIEVLEG